MSKQAENILHKMISKSAFGLQQNIYKDAQSWQHCICKQECKYGKKPLNHSSSAECVNLIYELEIW